MLLREFACLGADSLPELELLRAASAFERFLSRLDTREVGAVAGGVGSGFLGCFCAKRAESCPHTVTSPQATPTKTARAKTRLPERCAEGCWDEPGWPGVIPICVWSCRYHSKLDSQLQVRCTAYCDFPFLTVDSLGTAGVRCETWEPCWSRALCSECALIGLRRKGP